MTIINIFSSILYFETGQLMNLLQWSFHIRDIGISGMNTLYVSEENHAEHLKNLMTQLNAREGWFLTTCNRVEYLFILDGEQANALPPFTNLKPTVRVDLNAIVTHLLEIACATDSLIFGENQILGQLKKSYTYGLENNLLGPKLSKLFNLVIKEAKSIRTETGLNALNTSVAGVTVKILNKHLKTSDSILLVGSGETHQMLAQAAVKRGFKNIYFTSRSHAKKVASEMNLKCIPWNDYVSGNLSKFAAISFATPSKTLLLSEEHMKNIKPKLVVDLSVPQNTDAKIVKKFKSKYFNIEDIQDSLTADKEHVEQLKKIVQNRIKISRQNILNQISILDLNHLIQKNISLSKMVRDSLIAEKLPTTFTKEQREALSKWSESLINKINHIHIESLKNYVLTQNRDS